MKLSRLAVTILVAISAFEWFCFLLLKGYVVPSSFFEPMGLTVSGLVLLLGAFDRWIWKWLPQSLSKRPNISGTWEIDLQSNFSPTTEQLTVPVRGFLVIRQTFSTVEARLLTAESQSHQLAAQLIMLAGDDEYGLIAVYRNEPKILLREKSRVHFGALILRIPIGSEKTLSGEYWTDRSTCGELSGRDRQKKRFSSFGEAEAHWAQKA
jgi:hypothetical protein